MHLYINISPKRITKILLTVVGCLLIASLLSNYLHWGLGYQTAMGFIPMFDMELEYNLPTLYSSLAILCCAGLLRLISVDERKVTEKDAKRWRVLSTIFIFLSIDEMISVHNQTGRLLEFLVGDFIQLRESRNWTFVYLGLLALLVFYFAGWFARLPHKTKVAFAVAGWTYIAGAIGIELLGDYYLLYTGEEGTGLNYVVSSSLEELMEMLGILLFIRALVAHISFYDDMPNFTLSINFQAEIRQSTQQKTEDANQILPSCIEKMNS